MMKQPMMLIKRLHQYLLMMIDLLKRIIEVIQALDLTVNIDIRDIKNKLKQLEDRSGYPLRG